MVNLETYKMFVNGEWIGSEKSETIESINTSIGKTWALIPETSASDVKKLRFSLLDIICQVRIVS